jgi:hypothetical protein
LVTWITPAHMHISFALLLSAGFPPIKTVGDGGTHGAVVAGMQGIGVSTPSAAAVAAMTIGLEGELHIPNGMMFIMGTLSMIVAANFPSNITGGPWGTTTSTEGATPKEHASWALMTTGRAIAESLAPARASAKRTSRGIPAG